MHIFTGGPGRIVSMNGRTTGANLRLITIEPELSYQAQRIIVTGLGIKQSVNFQGLRSLDRLIYVYVFGDHPADLVLSGVVSPRPCEDDDQQFKFRQPPVPGLPTVQSGNRGVSRLFDYYDQNKLSVREDPVSITFDGGKPSFRSLLVGLSLDTADVENQLFSFTMPLFGLSQ